MNETSFVVLKRFATSLRASSLIDDLRLVGIRASAVQSKWTNKKLPPPRIEVVVSAADAEARAEAIAEVLRAY